MTKIRHYIKHLFEIFVFFDTHPVRLRPADGTVRESLFDIFSEKLGTNSITFNRSEYTQKISFLNLRKRITQIECLKISLWPLIG